MYWLAALTLLISAADHWTTYLCLRAPVAGWDVVESNPLAAWLFEAVGLVPGLLIDSVVTLVAIGFLLSNRLIPERVKGAFFGVVITWTTLAVVNNWRAIEALGLSPLGGI